MKLTLGFSPCPNDTFIFDALVNGKIDNEGYEFEVVMEDVQTLNQWALAGKLDISKVSYGVLPMITDRYIVLNSGGALGRGVGPLLVAKSQDANWKEQLENTRIAIPGEHTTAHLLFSYAFPSAANKYFTPFHRIEEAVLSGEADAGVIIHESRFTYHQKGLKKWLDLGEFWEQQTNAPIPLGAIVADRQLEETTRKSVDRLIRKSLEYAFDHYPAISDYVQQHAQEMSEEVMRNHIDLYVNDFSLDLGEEGKKAVHTLLNTYNQLNEKGPIFTELFESF